MSSIIKVNTIQDAGGNTLAVSDGSGNITTNNFKDIQWQSVITADGSTSTTAEAGKGYIIDTSSNTHTINLPASPSAGDVVAVIQSGSNSVTVGRNGNNILSGTFDKTLSTNASVTFVYSSSASIGWVQQNNDVPDTFVSATGGTETTSGNYKIHTFTSSGCFTVASTSSCASNNDVSYMVVAGGAGGGGSDNGAKGGGGGAGGFREGKVSTDSYTASPLDAGSGITVTATTYPITVGAGGAAGSGIPINPQSPDNGSNSVFSTITSTGGGKGATYDGNGAGPGGSGGGGAIGSGPIYTPAGSGNTPPVSPSQGSNGGTGTPYCGTNHASRASAGGGGATAAGANGGNVNPVGGVGGAGATTSISGSSTAYAGGGGGAGGTGLGGTGGTGGGGPGHTTYPGTGVAGTTNTGGGGGAAGVATGGSPANLAGGAGGSGIVIIRYKYQ